MSGKPTFNEKKRKNRFSVDNLLISALSTTLGFLIDGEKEEKMERKGHLVKQTIMFVRFQESPCLRLTLTFQIYYIKLEEIELHISRKYIFIKEYVRYFFFKLEK